MWDILSNKKRSLRFGLRSPSEIRNVCNCWRNSLSFWEVCLLAFLPGVRWEYWFYSHVHSANIQCFKKYPKVILVISCKVLLHLEIQDAWLQSPLASSWSCLQKCSWLPPLVFLKGEHAASLLKLPLNCQYQRRKHIWSNHYRAPWMEI